MAGDVHVVILEKDDVAEEAGIARDLKDALDGPFAGVVARVGLAGDDELDRLTGPVEEAEQAVEVAKEQIAAFVGGEAPGKADGQGGGIEALGGAIGLAAIGGLGPQAAADVVDEMGPQVAVRSPRIPGRRFR